LFRLLLAILLIAAALFAYAQSDSSGASSSKTPSGPPGIRLN